MPPASEVHSWVGKSSGGVWLSLAMAKAHITLATAATHVLTHIIDFPWPHTHIFWWVHAMRG